MAEYSKSIELDPSDPSPLINRGLIFAGRKQFDRAIADYDTILAASPDFALAHFNKAKSLDQGGRLPEAIAEYRAFVTAARSTNQPLVAEARQRVAALERQRKQ